MRWFMFVHLLVQAYGKTAEPILMEFCTGMFYIAGRDTGLLKFRYPFPFKDGDPLNDVNVSQNWKSLIR